MSTFEARVDDLVLRALEIEPDQRDGFLARECGQDLALRNEVQELLSLRDSALQRAESSVFEMIPRGRDAELEALGPYKLETKIGEGGTSFVYQGRRTDGSDSRPVAIKLLKRGMETEEILRRFEREGNILSSLHHPHIARVFGGGVSTDDRPYLVMELVRGKSIRAYCSDQELPTEGRIQLLISACKAVAHAHRHLVIHRDLKPENMLVTEAGQLKILDFGISKLLAPGTGPSTVTAEGLRMLTPEYAAPEQLAMGPVSIAVDVYSLGVVLYELLVGRLPFVRGSETQSFLRQVLDQKPRSLRAQNPQVGSELEAIVLKALAKEPAQRYRTVEAFAQDLSNLLERKPVRAVAGGWHYSLRKLLLRRRRELAFASLLAAALIAFLIDRVAAQRQLQSERDRAVAVKGLVLGLFGHSDPYYGGSSGRGILDHILYGWEQQISRLVSRAVNSLHLA